MTEQTSFDLLKASLFTGEDVALPDWKAVYTEMCRQGVAALPGEWLRRHPVDPAWSSYCAVQQGRWVRVMHGQDGLVRLLEAHDIPCVIIKGAAAAMAYPRPSLRDMGDVDVLVKRCDMDRAAAVMEAEGYTLVRDKNVIEHHYNYRKDGISFELHRRLSIVREQDERLLSLFEKGIDRRQWHSTADYSFPALPSELNGLVLMLHINQHLREGLGLRQIVDWMMYADRRFEEDRERLMPLLRETGMEKLALTVNAMCRKYLGLRLIGEDDGEYPCEGLMRYVMEQGNFGYKAKEEGVHTSAIYATDPANLIRRLQYSGGVRWTDAKRNVFLRPFLWIRQSVRVLGILMSRKMKPSEIAEQLKQGREQRKLIESLGLKVDRMIQ